MVFLDGVIGVSAPPPSFTVTAASIAPQLFECDLASLKSEVPCETITADPEEDDSEAEDVSEWEVPSWNDLIAGLYRPDR